MNDTMFVIQLENEPIEDAISLAQYNTLEAAIRDVKENMPNRSFKIFKVNMEIVHEEKVS